MWLRLRFYDPALHISKVDDYFDLQHIRFAINRASEELTTPFISFYIHASRQ